jgi:hypothetical protein
MINSYLGKFFLIALLIFATCINKFLGIFVVFVLFLMYYKKNNYAENFETVKAASDSQNTSSLANKLDSSKINVITTKLSSKTMPTTTTMTTPALNSIKNGSGEGVDLQSTETNIIRGKQSNSIPIREKTKEADNNGDSIMPYDKSNFTEEFSIL